MTAAVAYVRMSSNKQEASPKQQREETPKCALTLTLNGTPPLTETLILK